MEYEELTKQIIGCSYQVYNTLGSGFLESVYERILLIELCSAWLRAQPIVVLETTVNRLKLSKIFVIGSGPPGSNANVICNALDEGWGAVICKTVSLDAGKVVNVQPRYARLRSRKSGEIYGWEKIELISDRSFETWIDEFKQVKDKYPEGILIASIMEEYNRDAWHEIVERCQDAGCDSFELNMSCPHGLPERKMGAAMGENPDILEEVCRWLMEVAKRPIGDR